ncbi:FimB/Mfa2 family fimbrial subunit [Parabacteroides sp. OttesenSCG-928-N08]|nr:FimB/Mfa2 family fimbrial subunit [Parabacteroides sp. OttesenSCG-928-N08]
MKKMKNRAIPFRLMAIAAVFALFTTGCVNETLDDCPGEHAVTLVVHNLEDFDVTEGGDVSDATIYIFDEDNNFLDKFTLTKGQIRNRTRVPVNYSPGKKLRMVGWGNTDGMIMEEGDKLEDFKVKVQTKSDDYANSPNDLYLGKKEFIIPAAAVFDEEGVVVSTVDTVIVRLQVGYMVMETEGLQNYMNAKGLRAGSADEFLMTMESNPIGIDCNGNGYGDKVDFNPNSKMDTDAEWKTTDDENCYQAENIERKASFSTTTGGVGLSGVSELEHEKRKHAVKTVNK